MDHAKVRSGAQLIKANKIWFFGTDLVNKLKIVLHVLLFILNRRATLYKDNLNWSLLLFHLKSPPSLRCQRARYVLTGASLAYWLTIFHHDVSSKHGKHRPALHFHSLVDSKVGDVMQACCA